MVAMRGKELLWWWMTLEVEEIYIEILASFGGPWGVIFCGSLLFFVIYIWMV